MIILFAVAGAFKLWMLLDCLQRFGMCCGNWWFYVIIMPGGDLAYFWLVKQHDPEMKHRLRKWFARPERIEALEAAARHCPSHTNRLRYAQALYDHGRVTEADDTFCLLLKTDPQDRAALLGHGLSALQRDPLRGGTHAEGIAALETLARLELDFREFMGAKALLGAYLETERKSDAARLLADLDQRIHSLRRALTIAEVLIEHGLRSEARAFIEKRLANSTGSCQRIEREPWLIKRNARKLLMALHTSRHRLRIWQSRATASSC